MTRATLLLLLAALAITATMAHGTVLPAWQAFSAPEWTPAPLAFSRSAPEEGAFPRPATASDPSELSPVLTSGLVVGR